MNNLKQSQITFYILLITLHYAHYSQAHHTSSTTMIISRNQAYFKRNQKGFLLVLTKKKKLPNATLSLILFIHKRTRSTNLGNKGYY